MKILVTGSDGFLGQNLVAQLKNEGFEDILLYTKKNSLEDLQAYTAECDFIYHLAGVNRPKEINEFREGNVGLTEKLIEFLNIQNKSVPIVLSSSVQAELDNPYGNSKRSAEEVLLNYGNHTKSKIMIYRLKNLYGKWSRPNYNSVVATFCYNIARNLPIEIRDRDAQVELSYIEDVVFELVKALKSQPTFDGDYCVVPVSYTITLGDLANKIKKFSENRVNLIMPSLKEQFDRNLYATYLSYLEEDNFSYMLKKNEDERGWLAEFIKSEDNGQIFISTTKPGITRGNHWHHTKVEKFLVIKGTGVIRFRNINEDKIIEYPVSGEKLEVVDIPVGYTHSITNTGENEMMTLFWACEIFDPQHPDTYYLEVKNEKA